MSNDKATGKRERIAVIGSGISGMGAAWLLGQRHEVVLYEANARTGGHTNTVEVSSELGSLPVDTGFIVYNERNYPLLTRLFDYLRVPTLPSDMSFGVTVDDGRIEYAGDNLNTLFAQRSNLLKPSHWRMLLEILRFNKETLARMERNDGFAGMTLGEYLDVADFSERFRQHYLLPMGGAIWSCPLSTMLAFPAASFARFFANHGLLSVNDRPKWRTVSGGSKEYMQRVLRDFTGRVRRGVRVVSVRREDGQVRVTDHNGRSSTFDRVVLAAHADESLAMLDDASVEERAILGAFEFQENHAVLHTDTRLLPRRKLAWSSWNYLADADTDGTRRVSVSYWMNRLQSIPGKEQFIVTLNPVRQPDPDKVRYDIEYSHPVFTTEAMAAQQKLDSIQGERIYFCGAWTGYGFHEDGFRSAVNVAAKLGIEPPWEAQAPDMQEAV